LASGCLALPPRFHVVTLTRYYNCLVRDSTIDTFDYHIKLLLKVPYSLPQKLLK